MKKRKVFGFYSFRYPRQIALCFCITSILLPFAFSSLILFHLLLIRACSLVQTPPPKISLPSQKMCRLHSFLQLRVILIPSPSICFILINSLLYCVVPFFFSFSLSASGPLSFSRDLPLGGSVWLPSGNSMPTPWKLL